MEGGRGARRPAALSSSTGSSWASFEEKAKDYELKSGLGPSRNPFSPTTRQLCREDMAIYGEEPASDSLALVVCEQCGRVVKSQALSKHKELYHSKVFHIPPPKHIGHPSRIHTVGQPSVGGLTDEPRGQFSAPILTPHQRRGSTSSGGGSGVMGFAATELPRQNSSSTSGGGGGLGMVGGGGGERGGEEGNTGSGRSSKEYDPNRHCGVWVEDEQKHCTRSLTCKFHPLSQKGRVRGRSRPFAELLEEHRRRKKLKKQGKLGGGGHTPSLPHPSPSDPPPLTADPLYPHPPPPLHHSDRLSPPTLHPSHLPNSAPFPHVVEDEEGGGRGEGERGGGEWVTEDQSEEEDANLRDLPSRPDYPQPLAVCSFGARSTRGGSSVFGNRSDHLRSLLASLSGRSKDYTETTLHRKHSYSALLQQRKERKYFTHKDMFSNGDRSLLLRPVVSATADVQFAPPLSEYTIPLPPSSPPPTIPIITRPPATSCRRPPVTTTSSLTPMTPGAEISSTNHIREPPTVLQLPSRMNGGGPQHNEVVGAPREVEDGEEAGGREGERLRSKERRRKKGRGRRKRKRLGETDGETATEEPIHNHIPHLIPEIPSVAGATQVGVANHPLPASRVDGTRGPEAPPLPPQLAVSRRGGGGERRGRKGSTTSDFRMVRIKQEPMDDEQDHRFKTKPPKPNSLVLNGIVTTPPPPHHPPPSSSSSQSPIHSFNAASTAGRGAQSFVINPSAGRGHHHIMSPHLGGLLPLRGSTLQSHHSPSQQQQQQQQPPQGFTFGHSLQGLPVQMINDSLQRHMLQHGTLWLTPPQQTHPQITPPASGGGVVDPHHRQQNLVAPSIIHSLGGNSTAPPGYPQSLTNQHHAHFLSFQRANPAATSGRVRAPISPVPSGVPLHEALTATQRLPGVPTGAMTPGSLQPLGGGAIFGSGQSHLQLHGKQGSLTTPPGPAPPSQRVT